VVRRSLVRINLIMGDFREERLVSKSEQVLQYSRVTCVGELLETRDILFTRCRSAEFSSVFTHFGTVPTLLTQHTMLETYC
jgi:hypothetical protein